MPVRRWTIRIILKTGFAESYIEVVAEAFAVRCPLGARVPDFMDL